MCGTHETLIIDFGSRPFQFGTVMVNAFSRDDSVETGEHTRPRVSRPAPSPVGLSTLARTEWWIRLKTRIWWARAPTIASEADALPRLTELLRSNVSLKDCKSRRRGTHSAQKNGGFLKRFESRHPPLPHHTMLVFVFLAVSSTSSFGQSQVTLTNKWELNIHSLSDSSPAIGADGTIYFGIFQQKLWAVSSNGVPLWAFKTASEIKSSPAIGKDGIIYFGCRDRKFYALDSNGKEKWEFKTGGWVDSSPALAADGTICFGSWDGKFYALKPDGSLKWQFSTEAEIMSSPAIGADGTIYFGSDDKKFYALTPQGKKKWAYTTGGQIISSPALGADGAIYFTSLDGFFYALNPDGSLRWRLKTGGITPSSPVIGANGTPYVGVNKQLWAITADGKKKWEAGLDTFVDAPPVVLTDKRVCAICRFGYLVVFDAGHQHENFYHLDGYGSASPGIGGDGTIYVAGVNGRLCALVANRPLAQTLWPKFHANARNTGRVKDATQ